VSEEAMRYLASELRAALGFEGIPVRVWFRYKEARAAMHSERVSRRGRPLAMRGGFKAQRERSTAAARARSGEDGLGGRAAPSSFSVAARDLLQSISASSRDFRSHPASGRARHRESLEERDSAAKDEVGGESAHLGAPGLVLGEKESRQGYVPEFGSRGNHSKGLPDSPGTADARDIRSGPPPRHGLLVRKSQTDSMSQVSKSQMKARLLLTRKPSAAPFVQKGPHRLKTAVTLSADSS
jgi:hypothetical protein